MVLIEDNGRSFSNCLFFIFTTRGTNFSEEKSSASSKNKIQLSSPAIMPLTDEQKAEFKQPFDAVDANGSGTVDASELKALILECIGVEPDDAAVAEW
jgi:Ca2+-binding EF-hand superfamily protein